MEIAYLIVTLIVTGCAILTVISLAGYFIKRRKARLKYAAVSFATAVLSISLLIMAEELFFSYNSEDKEEVLVASREAPIGGILLKLYEDSTFEIGGFRQVDSKGTFEMKSDTLILTKTNKRKQNGYIVHTSYLVKEDHIEEVEDTGVGSLEIHVNKLK